MAASATTYSLPASLPARPPRTYNYYFAPMRIGGLKTALWQRPKLLWLVLGAMLLVSVIPLALYHHQVLKLSEEKLTDTESVQQTEVTRSVGDEILFFDSNLKQQLISQRQILAVTGLLDQVDNPVSGPQVQRLLENFVASNPDILYLTAVGRTGKGAGAGNFPADQDPFVGKALQRGFAACARKAWSSAVTLWRSAPKPPGPGPGCAPSGER